jgi:hypothetical protein
MEVTTGQTKFLCTVSYTFSERPLIHYVMLIGKYRRDSDLETFKWKTRYTCLCNKLKLILV